MLISPSHHVDTDVPLDQLIERAGIYLSSAQTPRVNDTTAFHDGSRIKWTPLSPKPLGLVV
jgi:hypothetical protein